jgi:hypothetical protein
MGRRTIAIPSPILISKLLPIFIGLFLKKP